jgi:exopolysaccharide production protein ExoQ
MSRALARFDPAEFFVPIGVGLSAAMLGGLAGFEPKLAVGAAFGIAFALLTLANLPAGVVAFTLVMFLELSPVAGGSALSFTKLAGAILLISWIASFTTREHGRDTIWNLHPILSFAIVGLCAWVGLSFIWAEKPSVVPAETLRLLLTAILFLILFEAIRTPKQIRMVLGAFVIGATFAALYGVVVQPDASQFAYAAGSSGLNRIAGTVGDPNVLAATLAAGLMISIAMAFSKGRSSIVRALCLLAAVLCLAGVFLTGSRGGLVALAGAVLAAIALAPRHRALAAFVGVMIAIAGTYYYADLAPQAARDRLSLADGGTGRTDIWKVGWRMIEDKPITGAGAANFQISSIHYLLAEPGALKDDTYVADKPAVAHNAYIHVLAEFGIPGLAFFLTIVIGSIAAAYRAAKEFGRRGDPGMELIAASVAVALVALLAADFFVSEQFNKQLWLLMALCPAMLAVARRGTTVEA